MTKKELSFFEQIEDMIDHLRRSSLSSETYALISSQLREFAVLKHEIESQAQSRLKLKEGKTLCNVKSITGFHGKPPAPQPKRVNQISKEEALEALDNIDDCARMDISVNAIGPRDVLERFISQSKAPATND